MTWWPLLPTLALAGNAAEPPTQAETPSVSRAYAPPAPNEGSFSERTHVLFAFHWGLPGRLIADGRALKLDDTLGFNLRVDLPFAKYVLIGPMLQVAAWREAPDTAGLVVQLPADHFYFIDLDVLLRFRVPIVTSRFNYQLWLGTPIGLSADLPGSSSSLGVGWGWNIGGLFGAAVHFTSKVGIFAEIGWEQHRLTHPRDGQSDADATLQQALLNLGIVAHD